MKLKSLRSMNSGHGGPQCTEDRGDGTGSGTAEWKWTGKARSGSVKIYNGGLIKCVQSNVIKGLESVRHSLIIQ